ncbi:hypothetical protein NE237_000796 [Protea cynaroides]|uniref:Uncharacterized protein n=1 Tax=Protea cynaroides TaxID=273540 RepID=A0A9Q0QXU5_9MAGN|nr:hypothetical protein NE237_000796 [Protea cynaroides]
MKIPLTFFLSILSFCETLSIHPLWFFSPSYQNLQISLQIKDCIFFFFAGTNSHLFELDNWGDLSSSVLVLTGNVLLLFSVLSIGTQQMKNTILERLSVWFRMGLDNEEKVCGVKLSEKLEKECLWDWRSI